MPDDFGNVIRVPDDFESLGEAVAAARNFDEIYLDAGLFSGEKNCNLLVTANHLCIRGAHGERKTIVVCPKKCLVFKNARGVEISSIAFDTESSHAEPEDGLLKKINHADPQVRLIVF